MRLKIRDSTHIKRNGDLHIQFLTIFSHNNREHDGTWLVGLTILGIDIALELGEKKNGLG